MTQIPAGRLSDRAHALFGIPANSRQLTYALTSCHTRPEPQNLFNGSSTVFRRNHNCSLPAIPGLSTRPPRPIIRVSIPSGSHLPGLSVRAPRVLLPHHRFDKNNMKFSTLKRENAHLSREKSNLNKNIIEIAGEQGTTGTVLRLFFRFRAPAAPAVTPSRSLLCNPGNNRARTRRRRSASGPTPTSCRSCAATGLRAGEQRRPNPPRRGPAASPRFSHRPTPEKAMFTTPA